jgi:stress response protein YsnF
LDGKKIDSHKENEVVKIFLKIKDKIKRVFFHTENKVDKPTDTLKVKYYDVDNNILNEKQNTESGKSIPLSDDKKNPKIENIIPIWGEEIVISKRMVKLGEFIVKKYQVTETKKIDVELFTEKLTIHNPNSPKEEIT